MKVLLIIVFTLSTVFVQSQNLNSLLVKANELYKKNEFSKSFELFKQAALIEPDNATISYNLGLAAYKTGDFDIAISSFNKVIEHTEQTDLLANAYYNLGIVYAKKNLLGDALQAFKKSLRLNSNNLECKQNLQLVINAMPKPQSNNTNSQEKEANDNKQPSETNKDKLINGSGNKTNEMNEDEIFRQINEKAVADKKALKTDKKKDKRNGSGSKINDW